jgi:Uncharacterized protein conserved in bacteria
LKLQNNITDKNLNIVLFDGYCGLCSKLVDFLLKNDKKKKFYYSSQQSEFAERFLEEGLTDINAIFYFHSGRMYTKSTAIVRIIYQLGGVWKLGILLFIIPAFLRNLIYDWIARKRYLWFGKTDACYFPKPEFKERFLDT